MSWIGLRHKGVEPLYPDEWNKVVDALDILYGYQAGLKTQLDCLETKVDHYYLEVKREINELETKVNELNQKVTNLDEKVDKYYLELESKLDYLKQKVKEIYSFTSRPTSLETYRLNVSVTPIPLSDVDKYVKRIHVKVPSTALYLVYLGDSTKQDFILEPSDKEVLEIHNPRLVYVRSLGNVTIFVMLEI